MKRTSSTDRASSGVARTGLRSRTPSPRAHYTPQYDNRPSPTPPPSVSAPSQTITKGETHQHNQLIRPVALRLPAHVRARGHAVPVPIWVGRPVVARARDAVPRERRVSELGPAVAVAQGHAGGDELVADGDGERAAAVYLWQRQWGMQSFEKEQGVRGRGGS